MPVFHLPRPYTRVTLPTYIQLLVLTLPKSFHVQLFPVTPGSRPQSTPCTQDLQALVLQAVFRLTNGH